MLKNLVQGLFDKFVFELEVYYAQLRTHPDQFAVNMKSQNHAILSFVQLNIYFVWHF